VRFDAAAVLPGSNLAEAKGGVVRAERGEGGSWCTRMPPTVRVTLALGQVATPREQTSSLDGRERNDNDLFLLSYIGAETHRACVDR
jgi:hypothetical protein